MTVNGNSTLTDLPEGNHSLVIYANDTFGNMGKSDTTLFSIVLPTPSPSPTPTPTPPPTQQPTQKPSPTPTTNPHTDWIPYVIIAVAVALGIGATSLL